MGDISQSAWGIRTTPENILQVTAYSFQSAFSLRMDLAFRSQSGELRCETRNLGAVAANATSTFATPISAVELVGYTLQTTGVPALGDAWASVALQQPGGSLTPHPLVLSSGQLSSLPIHSWLAASGPVQSMLDPLPFVLVGTAPGAGSPFQFTSAQGAAEVLAASMTYTCSGAAANRIPRLRILDGGSVPCQTAYGSITLIAAQTGVIAFECQGAAVGGGGQLSVSLMSRFSLPVTFTLQLDCTNMDAADAVTNVRVVMRHRGQIG